MLGIRDPEEGGLDATAEIVVEGVDFDDVDGSEFGLLDQDVPDDGTADEAIWYRCSSLGLRKLWNASLLISDWNGVIPLSLSILDGTSTTA